MVRILLLRQYFVATSVKKRPPREAKPSQAAQCPCVSAQSRRRGIALSCSCPQTQNLWRKVARGAFGQLLLHLLLLFSGCRSPAAENGKAVDASHCRCPLFSPVAISEATHARKAVFESAAAL